jgi:hypothetical protein
MSWILFSENDDGTVSISIRFSNTAQCETRDISLHGHLVYATVVERDGRSQPEKKYWDEMFEMT